MDSPITISSSESSVQNSSSPDSIDSDTNIARLRLTREGAQLYNRNSTCTPRTLQKVSDWLRGLERVKRYSDSDSSSFSQKLQLANSELDINERHFLHEIIPIDFSNANSRRDRMMEDEPNVYCNAPDELSDNSVASNHKYTEKRLTRPRGKNKSQVTAAKARKYRMPNLREKQVRKSEDSDSNPENVKKQELCSYLQLMKPTDKKTVMILQNRRSVRVKNLSLMRKNRDLEKKLNEGYSEHTNENSISKFSPDQSANGTDNGFIRKTHTSLNCKRMDKVVSKSFHFPNPTNSVKNTVTYFDEATQEDWFKEWKKQPSKLALNSNNDCKIKQNCITEKSNNQLDAKIYILEARKRSPEKAQKDVPDETKSSSKEGNYWRFQTFNAMDMTKNNVDMKNPIQIIQSVYHSFSIPQPPLKFRTNICDFDKAMKDNQDLFAKSKDISNECKKLVYSATANNVHINNISRSVVEKARPCEDNVSSVGSEKRHTYVRNLVTIEASVKLNKTRKCDLNNAVEDRTHLSPSSLVASQYIQTTQANFIEELNLSGNRLSKKVSPLATNICDAGNIPPSICTIKGRNEKHSVRGVSSKIRKRWKSLRKKIPVKSSQNCNFKIKLVSKKKSTKCKKNSKAVLSNSKKKSNRDSVSISEKGEVNAIVSNDTSKFSIKKNSQEKLQIHSDCTKEPFILHNIINNPEHHMDFSSTSTDELLLEGEKVKRSFVKNKTESETKFPDPELPSTIMAVYQYKSNDAPESQKNKAQHTGVGLRSLFFSQILDIHETSNECGRLTSKKVSKIVVNPNQVDGNEVEAMEECRNNSMLTSFPKTCSVGVNLEQQSVPVEDLNSHPATFASFNKYSTINPFDRCLNPLKQKGTALESEPSSTNWASNSPSSRQKKDQHLIQVSNDHGSVIKVFYIEYNLILCQNTLVSFWTQTALGNVLGAQNMWIKKGSAQRLSTNNNCVFKEALEMVVSTEPSVAYIELWTKEHRSVFREGPVADVFAIVYFWKNGQNGLDKKVLQLENIKGFADDVQYSILKSSPKIIVSWHLPSNGVESQKTFVHCYQLTADFQSVCNISKFEAVEHYVSSLHNIEGCETLVMGSGENKITLWNIEHGYVATTIEMIDIKPTLRTLWVKCDRGFLFTLQQSVDKELRIIAIHGMNHSWKKLASYVPPKTFDRLKGVCIENGIVLACYDQGIICWNAHTAEAVFEMAQNDAEFISGKYIITVVNNQLNVKHAITYLLCAEEL